MTLINNPGSINQLRELLISLKAKKVYLVTGDSFYEKCGAKTYIKSISDEFIFNKFSEFQDNPKLEDVIQGIKRFLLFMPDVIVAIGGGSIIDMAKLINGLCRLEKTELIDSINQNIIKVPVLPLIAIPTTAGSGSESTHFAVIYVDKKKHSLAHNALIPSHVILDTELLKSQSAYQKAVSGIDAFSQAVESLWSVNSTEESREYSKRAIELIWFNLEDMIKQQNDTNLLNVSEGSHLAGKAINIAKTTAPHALAYGFTTHFGLAHGHAVALSLPYFVDLHVNVNNDNCADNRGVSWVSGILKLIANLIKVPDYQLPAEIARFIGRCGVETNFLKLNINKSSFIRATSDVNIERLGNNPVKVSNEIINNLFEYELNS